MDSKIPETEIKFLYFSSSLFLTFLTRGQQAVCNMGIFLQAAEMYYNLCLFMQNIGLASD